MWALICGILAFVAGIIGITIFFGYFLNALAAGIPVMLILGGALAIYLGIEEVRDKSTADTFDDTTDNLKEEVKGLKEEIKELKNDEKEEVTDEEKADT